MLFLPAFANLKLTVLVCFTELPRTPHTSPLPANLPLLASFAQPEAFMLASESGFYTPLAGLATAEGLTRRNTFPVCALVT